ncbi:hypothetical protein C883_3300 [Bacillus stratosphericus LAMA 585]|uniref:Rok-like winged helix domain-containing protein n=1 Tax=Bacillus altitudinis TaxID=293387 RepID=UPI0002BEBCA8|nr:hypothetical protein [Bacillus altitudinis]EMI13579.1 hypothetical protein C883_3300 [Bacillus stratosphericus LAMA 585]
MLREKLKLQLILLYEKEQEAWQYFRKERELIYHELKLLDMKESRPSNDKIYYAARCVDIIKEKKGSIVSTKELKEQLQAQTDFNVRRISELYDLIQQLDPHISKARRGCFIYEDHTQVPLQSFHT